MKLLHLLLQKAKQDMIALATPENKKAVIEDVKGLIDLAFGVGSIEDIIGDLVLDAVEKAIKTA